MILTHLNNTTTTHSQSLTYSADQCSLHRLFLAFPWFPNQIRFAKAHDSISRIGLPQVLQELHQETVFYLQHVKHIKPYHKVMSLLLTSSLLAIQLPSRLP
ncbi:unnamed protein product [Lactuca saligna]|uniref:Uncharacterized protein n=1 Tax=Lactuca saligna TaxID=75948 RepID=A0AA35VKA2_LACSI|nr:unnamed protein product [Lactuca saligna]